LIWIAALSKSASVSYQGRDSGHWRARFTQSKSSKNLGDRRSSTQICRNLELKIANGCYGWSEHAPFDKTIMAGHPDLSPPPLILQLKSAARR